MLNDIPNVMTELAPKRPRFVEVIEIMDWPDIPKFVGAENVIISISKMLLSLLDFYYQYIYYHQVNLIYGGGVS